MPGAIANTTPAWARSENASVFDPVWLAAIRRLAGLMGANDPQSQVLSLLAPMDVGNPGGVAGALQRVIKAYHGSPHDFEKFAMEKIGTGEGAQAYGHGLYFAERENIAKFYKDSLSRAYSGTPQDFAQKALQAAGGNRALAAEQLQARVGNLERAAGIRAQARGLIDAPSFDRARYDALTHEADVLEGGAFATHPKDLELMRTAAQVLASNQPLEGRMYEVAIKASPDQFLDWDKPLSQQSEFVRKAIGPIGNSPDDIRAAIKLWEDAADRSTSERYIQSAHAHADKLKRQLARSEQATGAEFYRNLADTKGGATTTVKDWSGSPSASEQLKALGVPGIKYLDQGSRAAGEGSRNYVVFDEALIDILRKYGLLPPVAGAALTPKRQSSGPM